MDLHVMKMSPDKFGIILEDTCVPLRLHKDNLEWVKEHLEECLLEINEWLLEIE